MQIKELYMQKRTKNNLHQIKDQSDRLEQHIDMNNIEHLSR